MEFEEITELPMKEIEFIDIQNNQHNIIEHQPTHQEAHVEDMPHEEPIDIEPIDKEAIRIRRSTRNRKTSISSDYIVYLQEFDLDVGVGCCSFSP